MEEGIKKRGGNSSDDIPGQVGKPIEVRDTIGAILLAVVAIAIIVGGVKIFNIAFLQLFSPTDSTNEIGGINATNFLGYNATETHFHDESGEQNLDSSEKNTSADESSDSAVVTSTELTEPTTTTPAATTTPRPGQTEQPYTPPPPPPTESTEPPTDPPTDPPIIEGVDENGLVYRIENGTATITGYQGTETEVIIPEKVAGVPVYAIGKEAFKSSRDSVDITRVVISNNVSVIGEGAFRGCTYLQEVVLPISIKEIGAYAFFKNGSSDEITIIYSGSSEDWNKIAKTEDLKKIIKTDDEKSDEQDDEKYIILKYNDDLKGEW